MIIRNTKGEVVKKGEDEIIHDRISGYAAILNNQNQILMVKSEWNPKWSLPGGGIDSEELIEDGVIRECMEEAGYRVKIKSKADYVCESYFYDDILDHKFFRSTNHFFKATIIREERLVGGVEGEVEEICWVDINNLNKTNCYGMILEFIEQIRGL